MWNKIKGMGAIVGGIAVFIGVALFFVLMFHGSLWVGEKMVPWLVRASSVALGVVIFVLIPLAFFRKTRGVSGNGMMIVSNLFGVTLLVLSVLLTYDSWGILGVLVGSLFLGVGVVAIAILTTLFKGMWPILGELVLLTALFLGTWFAGARFTSKTENEY